MWGTLITLIALMVRGAREDVLTCEGRFPDATITVCNPTLREETAKDGAPGIFCLPISHLKSEMWGTLIALIALMVRGAREDVAHL
jgi:hypothetical protein